MRCKIPSGELQPKLVRTLKTSRRKKTGSNIAKKLSLSPFLPPSLPPPLLPLLGAHPSIAFRMILPRKRAYYSKVRHTSTISEELSRRSPNEFPMISSRIHVTDRSISSQS
jgi:hypothetical protein